MSAASEPLPAIEDLPAPRPIPSGGSGFDALDLIDEVPPRKPRKPRLESAGPALEPREVRERPGQSVRPPRGGSALSSLADWLDDDSWQLLPRGELPQPRPMKGGGKRLADWFDDDLSGQDARARAPLPKVKPVVLLPRANISSSVKIPPGIFDQVDSFSSKEAVAPSWAQQLTVVKGFVPDADFYHNFMEEAARKGQLQVAERWFEKKVKAGVNPSNITFQIMLQGAVVARNLTAATEWVLKAQDFRVPLTTELLSPVISLAASQQSLQTLDMFMGLLAEGPQDANITTYNIVIREHAHVRDLEAAFGWLDIAKAAHIRPDTQTLSIFTTALLEMGSLASLDETMRKLVNDGAEPTIKIINRIIAAFSEIGDLKSAEGWVRQASEMGLKPNRNTYLAVIKAARNAENLTAARSWFAQAELQESSDDDTGEDGEDMVVMMVSAALSSNAVAALRLYEEAVAQGHRLQIRTWNALIGAFSSAPAAASFSEASSWAEKAKAAGAPLNIITFQHLINAALHDPRVANASMVEQWLEEAAVYGVKPDLRLRSSWLKFLLKTGDAVAVNKWLRRWRGERSAPDRHSLSLALIWAVRKGAFGLAQQWLDLALEQGLVLEAQTYHQLADAAREASSAASQEFLRLVSLKLEGGVLHSADESRS